MRNAPDRAQLQIRLLEAKDVEPICRIDAELSGTDRGELLKKRLSRALMPGRVNISLVAVDDGQVVGFVLGDVVVGDYGSVDAMANLDTIGVRKAFQHKGVALQLLQAFANNLRALRVEHVHTQVGVQDWELLRFFGRVGFRQAQVIPLVLDVTDARRLEWDDPESPAAASRE